MQTTDIHTAAQHYYQACFGPDSDPMTAEDILSVEQLTHSFHGYCQWEILISTGGPAARVLVETDSFGDVNSAVFEYQDWFQPWTAPDDQDPELLRTWATENFYFGCPYCEQERRG